MLTLSDYRLTESLRDGLYTTIYRAHRKMDNTPVILKRLKQDYPTPEIIARLKREYEITQRLSEKIEGVAQVLGLEQQNNTWFMVFADKGGVSLAHSLTTQVFDLKSALSFAASLATTLGQIHQHNVIHKDINPANLIWHPDTQHVQIIDFGIASVLSREEPMLIHVNQLEGTLPYISPEQTGRMNRAIDYRTDFYSFGVTLYQLLTQQLPFMTEDTLELIHCHLAKMPQPPHELNADIPPIVSEIVLKLMAKMAEDRYQSALGLETDLRKCLTQLIQQGKIVEFSLAQADISDKFQIPQKLYGREAETQLYLEAFKQVSQGITQWMLVAGYSGIGKSALVHEIYKPITEKRGYFITGKFDQFQRNVPYSALVQAFSDLVRQLLMESEHSLTIWKQKLLNALGPNGQVIIEVIPEIEWIIGAQPAVPTLGATEAQNRFNLVFQNFVQVFCQPEHPLVVFLDDLQWVDAATLKLIELLLTQLELGYFFLIGAYRDNEVSSTHPLMMALEDLRQQQVVIKEIVLGPLTSTQTMQLLADTLHSNRVETLVRLVMRKTDGNPFFINQFLKTLYEEGLLTFDFELKSWRWDITHIEAMNITDNVVELMVNKLQKLPQLTQEILQLAACIGNQFDLQTLSWIDEQTVSTTIKHLMPALEEGLILVIQGQLSEASEQLQQQIGFKFLHDRVQQAAYFLIAADQKQMVHLQIGRLLLANINAVEYEEQIFKIVDHLNMGRDLIHLISERQQLAEFNLMAGKKAKLSTAYDAAKGYFQTGIELLKADCWQTQYELTWALYVETAETSYLQGNFEYMEKIIENVLQHAKTLLDKIKVYEIRISAYTAQNRLKESVTIGKMVLKQLKLELPNEPNNFHFLFELQKIKFKLVGKRIEDLWRLPETT
ncbi:MAG: serine/threonine-protein kinase PknK, partial [Pseudomonadota bacterium]|nr:serine/threonine-protein kinase PknK [Pseudomonadota bacterium]